MYAYKSVACKTTCTRTYIAAIELILSYIPGPLGKPVNAHVHSIYAQSDIIYHVYCHVKHYRVDKIAQNLDSLFFMVAT